MKPATLLLFGILLWSLGLIQAATMSLDSIMERGEDSMDYVEELRQRIKKLEAVVPVIDEIQKIKTVVRQMEDDTETVEDEEERMRRLSEQILNPTIYQDYYDYDEEYEEDYEE